MHLHINLVKLYLMLGNIKIYFKKPQLNHKFYSAFFYLSWLFINTFDIPIDIKKVLFLYHENNII